MKLPALINTPTTTKICTYLYGVKVTKSVYRNNKKITVMTATQRSNSQEHCRCT